MSIVSGLAATPKTPAAAPSGSMRAIFQTAYGSTDVLKIGTLPRPSPGFGEVLIRVRAAGLDRGTWHLMTGRPYLMRLMGFGWSRPKQPIAGLDLCGTVVALGAGVTRFAVGDEVFGIGNGSFAQYATARADKLAKKPSTLSYEAAAVLGVSGLTALGALAAAGELTVGQRVLVVGASGGVGSYAVQIAKAQGAVVTGVCSTAKVDFVRALGADHVVDYQLQDFADGSVRYDLILDIGGNTPLRRLFRAMMPNGRLVFVGGEDGGDWTAGFGRQLLAFALSPFVAKRFVMFTSKEHVDGLEQLAGMAIRGQLAPHLDRCVGLDKVAAAMHDLETGRIRGKIAIRID